VPETRRTKPLMDSNEHIVAAASFYEAFVFLFGISPALSLHKKAVYVKRLLPALYLFNRLNKFPIFVL
jgi:hypothetical protein